MNTAIFTLTAFVCIQGVASAELSNEELVSKTAIAIRAAYDNLTGEGGIPEALELFKDQTDAERTKALFLYMLNLEERSPMKVQTSSGAVTLLRTEPNFIRDKTTLKQMLETEQNARKFFLLGNLTATFKTTKGDDFIPSFWHMLFRDDPVAVPAREYNPPFIHDVSIYTYRKITGMLSLMDADFEPPQDKLMPYDERILILAKWLQENWPGCEDLQIPVSAERIEQRTPAEPEIRPIKRESKKASEEMVNVSDDELRSDFWWVGAAVLIALLLSVPVVRRLRA